MRAVLAAFACCALPAAAQPVALDTALKPWSGDFDGMLERRVVRVLVPYSRTLFFNDKGAQRGLLADALKDFEVFLNQKYKLRARRITVVALPTTRERLIPALLEGRGDIAAGNLTITAERGRSVDFTRPLSAGVSEIVVTGPASPPLASLDDLAGKEVHVRRSSTYYASLSKTKARLKLVPDALEDEDLMDMLAAGLLKLIVVDDWKAGLWAGMNPKLKPRPDLAVARGGATGWAFRPGSPKLAAELDHFVRTHPAIAAKRFKEYPRYLARLRNATADADWKRFEQTLALFRKYGAQYRFDYLMLAAQGYQESRLDQNARSHAGAVGLMQVMPDTGKAMKVGDIAKPEPNVHAGVKYMRTLYDRYFDDQGMDEQNRTLFAMAAYNAGPSRIRALRAEAAKKELDPHVWFNNVELVAARRVGNETVSYVRNIYKYYIAYKLQLEIVETRKAALKP
ncbi:MAG TPA: transglycosylase SLT domain-containing protein [Burkholderiales bacterium]